jgi:hypothetical protein
MPAKLDLTVQFNESVTRSEVPGIYRGDNYGLQFGPFLDSLGAPINPPASPVPRMKAVSLDGSITIDFSPYLSYTSGLFPLNLLPPLGFTAALVPGRYTYDIEAWAGFTIVAGELIIFKDLTI